MAAKTLWLSIPRDDANNCSARFNLEHSMIDKDGHRFFTLQYSSGGRIHLSPRLNALVTDLFRITRSLLAGVSGRANLLTARSPPLD